MEKLLAQHPDDPLALTSEDPAYLVFCFGDSLCSGLAGSCTAELNVVGRIVSAEARSGSLCSSHRWAGVIRWNIQNPTGATWAAAALGSWDCAEGALVFVTLTFESWKHESLFVKLWRWTACWCDPHAVRPILLMTVEQELYFERFKDSWLEDSGWLREGAAQCEAINFSSWPGLLGFVLPAHSECGSWRKHTDGLWSVCAADDPCLKALKGYKLPSCFGCEIIGNVDHLVWRRQAERCYCLEPDYFVSVK